MALTALFIAAFLGSLHCAAMCGGLVSFVGGVTGQPRSVTVGYHLARLVAYSFVGLAAGWFGARLNAASAPIGYASFVASAVGVLFIIWGSFLLCNFRFTARLKQSADSILSRFSAGFTRFLKGRSGFASGLTLGGCTPLLPCGFLYSFIALAAGAGSSLGGALVMAVFTVATAPALIGTSLGLSFLYQKIAPYRPRIAALALIVSGCFALSGHLLALPFGQNGSTPHCHDMPTAAVTAPSSMEQSVNPHAHHQHH